MRPARTGLTSHLVPATPERSPPRRGRSRCRPERIGQHRDLPGTCEPDTTAENRHNTISNQSRPHPESSRSRDGRIQAGGHPAGHARLGALEQQLHELAGPGVIDEIAAQAMLTGKVKGEARRAMTPALTIRATLLMGVLPDADYGEVMAALLGDLVLVPWQRPYEIPTGKVLSTWRTALGPAPLAGLQARLLAAVDAKHRDHDYRAVRVGDSGHELHLGSIDGSVTRVPDTPANREAFGSTGTADDSAPYPQVRDLLATDASTRGALAVVSGPSGGLKAEGEQALLDTMLTTCPQIFTASRLWVMDRNFPGADRVARMLAAGTHVLIRVKSDIALPRIGGFLPDGSYYSYLTGGGGRWRLKVRVIEYDADVDGQHTGELFCLISDLLDHAVYPAAQLAAAYAWRWTGSETALKEVKSAITGAGPSTGPIFRSAPARTRRIWNRPPARSDSRTTGLPITLRNHNPVPSSCTQNAVTNADNAEVHGIGPSPHHAWPYGKGSAPE